MPSHVDHAYTRNRFDLYKNYICTNSSSALQLRRRHGDIAVCTIAAGFHRLPVYGSHKVTAASEFKRRLFSSIYGSDKSHASLNGTPPALSARFCTRSLPLDIGEEELFLPQERLAEAIAKLDVNGWNMAGEFHRASSRRAFHLLSGVREEVLELSQGVDVVVSGSRIEYAFTSRSQLIKANSSTETCTDTANRCMIACLPSFNTTPTITRPRIAKANT